MTNFTASHRSSGRPMRPTGIAATSASRAFWFMPAVIGVSTMPGAIAPTRMPNGANSCDQVLVFVASAAVAADARVVDEPVQAAHRLVREVDERADLALVRHVELPGVDLPGEALRLV